MPKRLLTILVALCLVLTLPLASSAAPKKKSKKPQQVRGAIIDAATTTSLTLRWGKAKRAKRYEIEMANNVDMKRAKVVRTLKKPGATTIKGLKPGQRYCFQVRSSTKKRVVRVIKKRKKNGKVSKRKIKRAVYGLRSPRICKAPIVAEGNGTGPTYNVATYNLCVEPCARTRGAIKGVPWSQRKDGAAQLVKALAPDVLGLQEAGPTGGVREPNPPWMSMASDFGMAAGPFEGGKLLLYNPARFTVATDQDGPRQGTIRLGSDADGDRYAVWAELQDLQQGGKSVFFVTTHLAPNHGSEAQSDQNRAANIRSLLDGIAARNPSNRPVVILGDFNTHNGKSHDSPTSLLNAAGYHDSYDLARSLVRPHHNSGNQFKTVPVLGSQQGYHLDKIWVRATTSRVLQWRNGSRIVKGKYDPLPSDHSPIQARIQLDALP